MALLPHKPRHVADPGLGPRKSWMHIGPIHADVADHYFNQMRNKPGYTCLWRILPHGVKAPPKLSPLSKACGAAALHQLRTPQMLLEWLMELLAVALL